MLAARYDCATVQETMAAEEPIPGVNAATMRAVRNAHAARLAAATRAQEARNNRGMRNPYNALNAALAATNATAGGSGQQSAQPRMDTPPPVPAMNPRERFACHACGVRGHWKGDQPSQCRPEDVRAHIALPYCHGRAIRPTAEHRPARPKCTTRDVFKNCPRSYCSF